MSSRTSTSVQASEVTIRCPACRDRADSQRVVYSYALAYLCDAHSDVWAAADLRAHQQQGAGRCPHRPRTCVLDRPGCVQHTNETEGGQ